MNNIDYTITSPLAAVAKRKSPLLAITIAWHPDPSRIGEQFIGTTEEGVVEVSRFIPMFRKTHGDALPIGHGGVSREAMRIVRDTSDGVTICPPKSRMVVELNGQIIADPICLSSEQVETGAILALGRAVYLCVHWMRCLPKENPVEGFIELAAPPSWRAISFVSPQRATRVFYFLVRLAQARSRCTRHPPVKQTRCSTHGVGQYGCPNESLAAADLFGANKGAYTGAQNARSGFFAEAEGSTSFDEIGNTPTNIQPMLLRVLGRQANTDHSVQPEITNPMHD